MHLILVRHAQSEGNALRLVQGHTDYPLTEYGRFQAERLAERFAADRIDRVYASDLSRASDTARAIVERHGREAVLDPRLRERAYGAYENLTKREIIERGEPEENGLWIAPPGGEHITGFTDRVTDLLDDLYERHFGERIMLVTHSGVIARALLTLAGAHESEYRRFRTRNAAVSVIGFDDTKEHTLHVHDCCVHLEHVGRSGETSFLDRA